MLFEVVRDISLTEFPRRGTADFCFRVFAFARSWSGFLYLFFHFFFVLAIASLDIGGTIESRKKNGQVQTRSASARSRSTASLVGLLSACRAPRNRRKFFHRVLSSELHPLDSLKMVQKLGVERFYLLSISLFFSVLFFELNENRQNGNGFREIRLFWSSRRKFKRC